MTLKIKICPKCGWGTLEKLTEQEKIKGHYKITDEVFGCDECKYAEDSAGLEIYRLRKFILQSANDKDQKYEITINGEEASCTCKDYQLRRIQRGEYCKHIKYVINKYYLQK